MVLKGVSTVCLLNVLFVEFLSNSYLAALKLLTKKLSKGKNCM